MNGKGSKPRPIDYNKYVSNFGEINWNKDNNMNEDYFEILRNIESLGNRYMDLGFKLMNLAEHIEGENIKDKELIEFLKHLISKEEIDKNLADYKINRFVEMVKQRIEVK